MPDFGDKNVFFPHQKYRGELSEKETSNIVYVEYKHEVKAYDNIQYPSNYVNKILDEIKYKDNPENIISVWQGGYCSWKHPDWWKKEEPKKGEPKRPAPEEDDLPF